MGMSSTVGNVGSLLNSGLTLQNNQQGNQQGPGDVSIGMPYGPGYTQPGQQGPGDLTGQIGMPAGPGYMQPNPSTGGGKNMPAMIPDQGAQPVFNLPNPVTTPGPQDLTGQIGMPAGPGYMQPGQGANQQNNQLTRYVLGLAPGQDKQALMNDFSKQNIQLENERSVQPGMVQYYLNQDQYNQFSKDPRFSFIERPAEDIGLFPTTPNLGQPQIGMPAGPGYMQPTPLPSPTVKAQPTPLPPMAPVTQPINMPGQIGMPAGPGFMQPRAQPTPLPKPAPAPVTRPIVRPAPIPQTRQQIVEQVGLRRNPVAPVKVQPSLSTRPTGRIGRR